MIYAAIKTTRISTLNFQNLKGSPESFLQSISNNKGIPEITEEVNLHCAKVIVILKKSADKISAALIALSPLKVLLSNNVTRRADLHRGIVEFDIMSSSDPTSSSCVE
jgi:hypothetical protein